MFVWKQRCSVFPMCGFAGGFLGMVASLILSKGTQVVNVKISHTGVAVTTRNCGNDGALVGDHGLVSHRSSVRWKVKVMALLMITLCRDTRE